MITHPLIYCDWLEEQGKDVTLLREDLESYAQAKHRLILAGIIVDYGNGGFRPMGVGNISGDGWDGSIYGWGFGYIGNINGNGQGRGLNYGYGSGPINGRF